MVRGRFKWLAWFALVYWIAPPVLGDVAVVADPVHYPYVFITGEITATDVAKFRSAIARIPPQSSDPSSVELRVRLDSNGGDIDAAMAIGRLIKKKASQVQVYPALGKDRILRGGVCASACILILAAGSHRIGSTFEAGSPLEPYNSRVGIHRPYSTYMGNETSYTDVSARYAPMAARVKAYLEEMGVSARLYDVMMRVPADEVRWLTKAEQHEFGLVGYDPAFKDMLDSKSAAKLGISKREYFRRKELADRACPAFPYNPSVEDRLSDKYDNAATKHLECSAYVLQRGTPPN